MIPYSEDVISNVRAITSFINGHITSVELGTSDVHIVITEPLDEQWQEESKQYTFGAITGIVRTISAWTKSYTGQPKIRLAVEDAVFGRVVYCYLNDDQGELARKIWRSRVSITGMIFRDPDTGRPIEVRQVKDVQEVEPSRPKSYKQARGILPWHDGDEPSEVTMRRLRDAK